MLRALTLALLLDVAAYSERLLELHGRIDPAPARASVSIEGVNTTFSSRTNATSEGRFRFRKLPPGPYLVTVFVPGSGMSRRSVDVTPSLAAGKGHVETTIPFTPNVRPPRFRATVSLAELQIPDRARRELEKAQSRLRKRDTEGAAIHLRAAVELAPRFFRAWTELGNLAYRARKWDEAETCFRKALEVRPEAMRAALELGGVLLYSGKLEEAVTYNRVATERLPNDTLAWFQLGMSCLLLHQDDEAVKALRRAKELDPAHYSSPQLALAELYLRRGDRAGASSELEDFLRHHPDADNAPAVRSDLARLKR